jgi:hypothetical protein
MADEGPLRSIDAKLGALLAIALDQYLRETNIARPKVRSIDKLLTDAGLKPQQIAALLGKTERAVHLQLAAERQAKATRARKGQAAPPAEPSPESEV